ncbi:hypothetical protein NMY22_g17723 [Coprinellus aureogranulatus]|nr:hypothetical protein NMY22_g17723 [Coprinellus aureogranulatus]
MQRRNRMASSEVGTGAALCTKLDLQISRIHQSAPSSASASPNSHLPERNSKTFLDFPTYVLSTLQRGVLSSSSPLEMELCVRKKVINGSNLYLPPELRNEVGSLLGQSWRSAVLSSLTRECDSTRSKVVQTRDGFMVAITLESSTRTVEWLQVVKDYQSLRTPRLKHNLDGFTKFCLLYSPFRFLIHLDLVLVGRLFDQNLSESQVAGMGRYLSRLGLHTLTLRTHDVNPLLNGLVQWPRQPSISAIIIYFTRHTQPNQWKRPLFPHAFHAFPRLESLHLDIDKVGTPMRGTCHQPHSLYEDQVKRVSLLRKPRGETVSGTVVRVGRNVQTVCPRLRQYSWKELRLGQAPPHRMESEIMVWRLGALGVVSDRLAIHQLCDAVGNVTWQEMDASLIPTVGIAG